MKPLDELTFIDDYMFGEVMKNKDICKECIRVRRKKPLKLHEIF